MPPPSQRALLAFNIRLTFILELSALGAPCLTAFIPAPIPVAFSPHLFKYSFLPPSLPICLSAPLILPLGMRHFHPPNHAIPFQGPQCNPVLHPKVTVRWSWGMNGGGGLQWQTLRFKCLFIWVKRFTQNVKNHLLS